MSKSFTNEHISTHLLPAERWDILTRCCQKMGHLDSTCIYTETQTGTKAHIYNMLPAERWDILTGCCQKMGHLDSTCMYQSSRQCHYFRDFNCNNVMYACYYGALVGVLGSTYSTAKSLVKWPVFP